MKHCRDCAVVAASDSTLALPIPGHDQNHVYIYKCVDIYVDTRISGAVCGRQSTVIDCHRRKKNKSIGLMCSISFL